MVCRGELQSSAMCLHQFLPELCYEPLTVVHCNHQWELALADDVAEEGISNGVHIHPSGTSTTILLK